MSLLVWLPLNGHLDNQGTTEINLINSGTTIETNGKIGSCYYFNASAYLYENIYNWSNFNTSTFSICCWYKEPSPVASGNSQMITIGTNSGWNNIRIGILRRTSTGYPLFTVSDGTSAIKYNCTATNFLFDTWNHIACTYNNGEMKIYLNGMLDTTYTTTIIPVLDSSQHLGIGAASNGAEKLTGYLNDVRIYDHCLSAAEVHEISQGLVLHYKLDSIPINFSTNNNISWTNINIGQWYTGIFSITMADFLARTGAQNGDKFTFSVDINAISGVRPLAARVQHYNTDSDRTNVVGNQIAAGTTGRSFVTFTIDTKYTRLDFVITNGNTSITTTNTEQYKCTRIEYGEVHSGYLPIGTQTQIYDSSGYNHTGTISTNPPTLKADTPRYNAAMFFNGTNNYIVAGRGAMVKDAITVSIWGYKSTWDTAGRMVSCTEGGGWNFENNGGYVHFPMGTGTSSNTYRTIKASVAWADLTAGWHMFTGTYDGFSVKVYIDGEIKGTGEALATKTPIYYHASNSLFLGAEAVSSATTPSSGYYWNGGLSDLRVYATALSAEDIKALYEVGAKIDNKGNIHTYEYLEDTKESINKSGIISTHQCSEFFPNLHYDKMIYKEPDGSLWIHIAHHNNPGAIRFASTDAFATGVYVNENCWYDIEQNTINLSAYEFMVQQALTAGATNTKYRWIQSVSPVGAVYDNVKPAAVTRVTTNGYTDGTFGGLFIGGHDSTRARIANASSGNWCGSFGSWTLYQKGTPGYPNTVVTTGYMDLYLRIDNLDLNMGAKILKNSGINANTLIEF